MMTYALSLAPSATLAPLQYLELPVAAMLGYLVFRNFPNALTLTGIGIIIGAGLYMIHRERVTARQLITERAAPPVRGSRNTCPKPQRTRDQSSAICFFCKGRPQIP